MSHVFASKKDSKETMPGIALFQWKYFYDNSSYIYNAYMNIWLQNSGATNMYTFHNLSSLLESPCQRFCHSLHAARWQPQIHGFEEDNYGNSGFKDGHFWVPYINFRGLTFTQEVLYVNRPRCLFLVSFLAKGVTL